MSEIKNGWRASGFRSWWRTNLSQRFKFIFYILASAVIIVLVSVVIMTQYYFVRFGGQHVTLATVANQYKLYLFVVISTTLRTEGSKKSISHSLSYACTGRHFESVTRPINTIFTMLSFSRLSLLLLRPLFFSLRSVCLLVIFPRGSFLLLMLIQFWRR